ncbi:MAG: hypothetical protein FD123_3871 [Bacteroidetes bacterium]|nr:MAG: hypothetical protein FD123_3871 [Bacteroidota bacterium]
MRFHAGLWLDFCERENVFFAEKGKKIYLAGSISKQKNPASFNLRKNKMKRRLYTLLAAGLLISSQAMAFCGFYVAKADAKLFNKTSEVIMVRNGERSTITMSSDFEGDVKDFAIVVPVPVVLQKSDIKVVEANLFRKLDDYSGPRLVSYYDEDPCKLPIRAYPSMAKNSASMDIATTSMVNKSTNYQVKIEAQYVVGEYDILILSAKESTGLERWLTDNGYKLPEGAQEVLDPYVKSNLKFFVVKANTEEMKKLNTDKLRPIQISYDSPKFMLPIRLGMANAKEAQDMIVYSISKVGRTEVTNYRTIEVPTGQDVPLFVQEKFGQFYKDLYMNVYKKEGKNNVFLEYAWDISGSISQRCDPCVGPPPMLADLMTAGVNWVQQYHGGYQGQVYFSRLHVTYDRAHFPQDLMFQETPNKANYQARYVLHYPASSSFECKDANTYLMGLQKRRQEELNNLASLTGWDVSAHADYPSEYNQYIKKDTGGKGKKQGSFFTIPSAGKGDFLVMLLTAISAGAVIYTMTRKAKKKAVG